MFFLGYPHICESSFPSYGSPSFLASIIFIYRSDGISNVPYLVADKPIKQAVVELGTIAFQISMIFSSFFQEISRKGILISKMDFC